MKFDPSSLIQCEVLADLYNLTPAEAKLSVAFIKYHDLAKAAAEVRISLEHARSRFKVIRQKTNTKKQSEFVAKVLLEGLESRMVRRRQAGRRTVTSRSE